MSSQFIFLFAQIFLLQLVSFTVDSEPLQPTVCLDRNTSHVFSHAHVIPPAKNSKLDESLTSVTPATSVLFSNSSSHFDGIHSSILKNQSSDDFC